MPSIRNFIKLSVLSSASTVLPNEQFLTPETFLTEPKKNPVIILRSSWDDGNIGDQGHTPGTIRLLSCPKIQLEVFLNGSRVGER
jgi:hypothetical protein